MNAVLHAWRRPSGALRRLAVVILALAIGLPVVLTIAVLCSGTANAEGIPRTAAQHRRELVRIARQEWGVEANVALAAAQIHQESGWRHDARSAYAAGLAQFTPSTAEWIAAIYPDLGKAAPFSPSWAMRAMLRYDAWLYARAPGATECDRRWAMLRWYNGGEGHWWREAALAADRLDREAVDAQCGRATRAAVWCAENTGYPRRILMQWEPIYLAAGWPGRATCCGASSC